MLGCLILLLLLMLFEGAFIYFNLENVCNVWLFNVYEAVPVYMTALISFAAGVLLAMIFFAFGRLSRRTRMKAKAQAAANAESRKEKKRRDRKSRKEKRESASASYPAPARIDSDGGFKGNG